VRSSRERLYITQTNLVLIKSRFTLASMVRRDRPSLMSIRSLESQRIALLLTSHIIGRTATATKWSPFCLVFQKTRTQGMKGASNLMLSGI
jgi:hypothetical protein